MLTLDGVELDSFQVGVTEAGFRPVVKVSGTGDTAAVAPLNALLRRLHDALVEGKYTAVAVDVSELYLMNSSCLKAFAAWVHRVNVSDASYEVHFLTNPRHAWQGRSLRALNRMAPRVALISIVDQAAGATSA